MTDRVERGAVTRCFSIHHCLVTSLRSLGRPRESAAAPEGYRVQPIGEPAGIDHPRLRELAEQAVWVARLEEAMEVLEDLVGDASQNAAIGPAEDEVDDDPLAVAWELVQARWEDEDRGLEERVVTWLAADPEHWSMFHLILLDPWQVAPGQWRSGTPRWVRTLGTDTTIAHFRDDPSER